MKKLTVLCTAATIGISVLAAVNIQNNGATHDPPTGSKESHFKTDRMLRQTGQANPTTAGNKTPAHALRRAGSTGSSIYGWLGFTKKSGATPGFIELDAADGNYSDARFESQNTVTTMFIRNGRVFTYEVMDLFGMLLANNIVEYDMETGKIMKTHELKTDDTSQSVLLSAYDPKSDNIYGYSFTADGKSYQFFSAPASNPEEFSYIPEATMCTALTWNQTSGKLIGVTKDDDRLVEIDPKTAAVTELAKCPIKSDFISGLCFSPIDNSYIWNPNTEESSYLYKISIPDYTFTKICDYPTCEQFMALTCTDTRAIDPMAPAAPSIKNVILGTEEPQALFFYEIPSVTFNGTPIESRIDYEATVDGVYYMDGTVAAGNENFMINFIDITEGFHTFTLSLSLDGKEGPSVSRTIYVGNDTPLAPENVKLTETEISWDAVTKGVNNGVVDTDMLTYTVYLDDKEIASNVRETSIQHTLPGGEMALHRASVIAVCNGYSSEAGISNPLVAGDPLELPVSITPTQDQSDLCTILDANKDDRSFTFTPDSNGDPSFCYIYSSLFEGDDWVFLPPMNFRDADAVYSFALKAACSDEYTPEAFEVYIGKKPTPESMTQCIIGKTTVSTVTYSDFKTLFCLEEGGEYYIGLHGVSPADGYYMYLRDINVTKTDISPKAPASPKEISATAAPEGELKALISFTMPTTSVDGTPLAASSQLTATISSPESTTELTGKPGEKISECAIATKQGDNRIGISISSESGAGEEVSVNVYTGIAKPGAVKNLIMTTSEDNMTLCLSWEAPSSEKPEDYCPASGIKYYLCTFDQNNWIQGELIGTDVYSHEIKLPENAPQRVYLYGIVAENIGGKSDMLSSAACVAGTPWKLPFTESFANEAAVNGPVTILRPDASHDMFWRIADPANIGPEFALTEGHALIGSSISGTASKGVISIGKTSTEDAENAGVFVTYYHGRQGDIEVLVAGHEDMEPTSIGMLSKKDLTSLEEGYQEVCFEIPSKYVNRKWIQIYIRASVNNETQTIVIPSISVRAIESSVGSILSDKVNIHTTAGKIHLSGCEGLQAFVYTTDGKLVSSAVCGDTQTFSVAPGLYIVRCGQNSVKVFVGK